MRKFVGFMTLSLLAISLVGCAKDGNKAETVPKEVLTEASAELTEKAADDKQNDAEYTDEEYREEFGNSGSKLEECSIIYINGKEINLLTWRDKSLNDIIDEIDSTGVVFNSIGGLSTKPIEETITDVATVKESLNNIGDVGLWTLKFGANETDDTFKIEYFQKLEELNLRVDTNQDTDGMFALGKEKYTSKQILKAGEIENFHQLSGIFDENAFGALESSDYESGIDVLLRANHCYEFILSDFK